MTESGFPALNMLIDGQWTAGSGAETLPVENPATGAELGRLPVATESDIARAIASARRSFPGWSSTPPRKRAAILHRAAALVRARSGELSRLMALELGKPVAQGPAEVARAAELFEWHAEQALRVMGEVIASAPGLSQTALRVPIGPVAAFTPWNGPGASPARKMSAALASGCTIVLKPAEETPATAIALTECLVEAGVPPGALNLLFGHPAQISERLISDPAIRMITFTGSVPVGRLLAQMAGRYLKPAILELGGHSPVIVSANADPEEVARLALFSKYRNSGQICISPTRFLIHESHGERFTEALVAGAEALRVGDPLDPAVEMGPMIHARRLEAVDALVRDAADRGARVRTGGHRLNRAGHFYAPTVLTEVPDTCAILREEPFGPVAMVQPYSELSDAIMRANATDFGLAAYAFTDSAAEAAAITAGVETGILSINHFGGASPEIPFGGVKDSGYGREGGAQCFDGYLTIKSVSQLTRQT
ncbi:MAG: NAD-dependent succinate-semialdehyde dehydrogenase [Pararhodobacter sp.]|nr:NAD-dependent succinate-semialdehyde dehydrogenase [Pararhodobacter sp.]